METKFCPGHSDFGMLEAKPTFVVEVMGRRYKTVLLEDRVCARFVRATREQRAMIFQPKASDLVLVPLFNFFKFSYTPLCVEESVA